MRIRKNATISVLSYLDTSIVPSRAISTAEETRVCELNRSPWDVISFAPQSYPHEFQFAINDGKTMKVESVNAVNSVGSLKEEEEEERKFSLLINVDYKANNKMRKKKKIEWNERSTVKESTNYAYCNKTDGKGWQCRREAKQGHSLCEHHLTQLRSYHYNYKTHSTLKSRVQLLKPTLPITATSTTTTTTNSTPRRRNRTKPFSSSSSLVSHSSPSDFYYYSGFGPLWGKKRLAAESASTSSSSSCKSSFIDDVQKKQLANDDDNEPDDNHGAFEGVVDNDEEEDEDDAPKKRFRKPIKARSLKSLL